MNAFYMVRLVRMIKYLQAQVTTFIKLNPTRNQTLLSMSALTYQLIMLVQQSLHSVKSIFPNHHAMQIPNVSGLLSKS